MIVIEFVDGQSTRKIGRDGFITQELLKNTHKSNVEVVEGSLYPQSSAGHQRPAVL